ncbi:hypothetical protein AB0K87_36015, partial [Streptomyces sp. NPDC053705]
TTFTLNGVACTGSVDEPTPDPGTGTPVEVNGHVRRLVRNVDRRPLRRPASGRPVGAAGFSPVRQHHGDDGRGRH